MPTVALVLPTAWDHRQLAHLRARGTPFEFVTIGPDDADIAADFDPEAWLREQAADWRGRLDGVFSSSDYPGAALAAALARELGLPGPDPTAVLSTAHKAHARLRQQQAIPAAVPQWQSVDPEAPTAWSWPGPAFCKPVRGSFSRFAGRVADLADLRGRLATPSFRRYRRHWLAPWRRLLQAFAPQLLPGDGCLVEEVLHGALVTVEGFVHGDEVTLFGVVDSRCHPETGSFLQFDYPSLLPAAAQERLLRTATAAIAASALRDTLCNVELFWDEPRQRAWIVEVNPRLCGQFADLYEAVDGTHSYELAAALALGDRPRWRPRHGTVAAAASVPLRLFAPARVTSAPDRFRIEQTERRHAARVWSECAIGDELADFAAEDGHSIRYAVVNLGGDSRVAIEATRRSIEIDLDYQFERLGCC